MELSTEPFEFWYRNWRGEVARRRVVPRRVEFATSQWHAGPAQWFLVADDLDRDGAARHFAMRDISCVEPEGKPQISVQLRDKMTFRLRLAEAALVELAQVLQEFDACG